jgi:hypothetical protein
MRRITFVVVLALFAALTVARVFADPATGQALLQQLFGPGVEQSAFSDSFVAQVPLATVRSIASGYLTALGPLRSVTPDGSDFALTFARGTLRATLVLDAAGKVQTLSFHDEQSPADRAALQRLLAAEQPAEEWFAPEFLAKLPLERVRAFLTKTKTDQGAFVRVDERAGGYFAVFARGESRTQISTDAAGKIRLLYFAAFAPPASPAH